MGLTGNSAKIRSPKAKVVPSTFSVRVCEAVVMSVSILSSSRSFGDCCDCVVCAVSPEVIVTKVDAEVIIRVTVAATEHLG